MKKKTFGKNVIFVSITWLAFFFVSLFVVNRNDDFVFEAGIERYGSLWGWIKFFSNNWGGRVIPQGILVILLQLPDAFFNIINASMWVVLVVYICRVFDPLGVWNREFEIFAVSFLIFTVIPYAVLNEAVFWRCAIVLYHWGTACALIVFYPFICVMNGKKYNKYDIIASFLACIYASSFEQIAVFMSAACIIYL